MYVHYIMVVKVIGCLKLNNNSLRDFLFLSWLLPMMMRFSVEKNQLNSHKNETFLVLLWRESA